MKKTKFRLIALLLTLATVLSALASCGMKFVTIGEDSAETESDTEVQQESFVLGDVSEVCIVRPQVVSNDIRDLIMSARDYLKEKTGLDVTLTTDYTPYEQKSGKYYVVIGKTEYEISQSLVSATADGEIAYKTTEDTVALYAKNDRLLYIAIEKLMGDCVTDGELSVSAEYADKRISASKAQRDNWTFNFPAYPYGELDAKTYSAGYGLDQDKNCSYMQVANKTSPEDYKNYLKMLEEYGYKKEFENEIDGNLFASYTGALGTNIYAYYIPELDKTRIVDDKVSVTLSEFNYTADDNGSSRFYMFQMNTDSEDTFLVHLADNSWIVIDGGTTQYNTTDPEGVFVDEMYNFMVERSDLKAGEKLKISCWYMSHPHRDHFLGFMGLVNRYHDSIELQRVLANSPDVDKVVYNSNNPSYVECVKAIKKYYPDVLYLKAHTGMTVQLADAKIEVLYTQEDNIENWCADTQSLNYKIYDSNNSSLNCIITVAGVSVLELGDGFRADYLLQPYYDIETLSCDILKAAHHYYNPECDNFYLAMVATGKVEYILVNHWTNPGSATGLALMEQYGDNFIRGSDTVTYEFCRQNGEIVVNAIEQQS